MKKFFTLLLLLAMVVGLGLLFWKRSSSASPSASSNPLPTLPKPDREFRFAVLGRPSELALRALARMPEMQDLPLKFIVCKSPAQRWLMLASGQADVALASSDELALALPRYNLEVKVFPMARHQGNEQVVFAKDSSESWVTYLPGGIGQSLVLDLKDPQLRMLPSQTPQQALDMLKNGQVRGAVLWNPWLDQAKGQGFEAKGQGSSSLEVWCWSTQAEHTGRVTSEDGQKVVRSWFGLMRQLAEQPELTQRAIAEENELGPEVVLASLRGLQFLSAGTVMNNRADLTEEMRTQLKDKLNVWSLAGQTVVGDVARLQVELNWLDEVGLDGTPPSSGEESPAPADTPTPEASLEPTPSPSTDGDPFGGTPDVPPAAQTAQAGGDATRSGRLPGPAVTSPPKQIWSTGLPSEPTSPCVASPEGDQIFVGCAGGELTCLETASGRVQWAYKLDDRIRSAPACQTDHVMVACDSGQVVSLDRKTGARIWQAKASSDVQGPLAIQDGCLYAATLDGQVSCWNVGSGEEVWTQNVGGNITSGPAMDQSHLVVVGIDGKVSAFEPGSGKPLWQKTVGGACRGTPAIETGLAVFGCSDHSVYGLRLKDGSQAWQEKLPEEVACAPLVLGSSVYVGCKDNCIYSLHRGTGKRQWSFATRERIVNDLVGCGDTLYAVSQDMRLYAITASTGKEAFRHKETSWLQTPWVQNQTLYLPVSESAVRALR